MADALDFPGAPATNEKYPAVAVPGMPQYTWDGEKWTTIAGGSINNFVGIVLPAITLPLMNGVAAIGTNPSYVLGDHVHPTDTTRADATATTEALATKIGDAPSDDKQYARENATWTEVVATSGGIPEAPIDTKQYARKDAAWSEVVATGGGGGIEEAPNDGLQYARQGLNWAEVLHQSYSGVQNYMFNATTTAPPAAGGIRFNNATQAAVTTIWLHYVTNDVNSINLKNYFLQRVKIGDTFYIQDKDAPTKWQLYQLASAFTDNGTYAALPVIWLAGESALTAARVIISREGASVNSPIGEAPDDGIAYVRKNQAWVPEASTVIYMGSFF